MIFLSEYAALGITEIVIVKKDFFPGHHRHDTNKTYHELVGKRDGKYFKASFRWTEPVKPPPGLDKIPNAHSEYGTTEISAEEYAALLKENGLWGSPLDPAKKPAAPRCPSCGGPMKRRTNSRTGDQFWGCMSYPRCKGTWR